MMLLDYIKRGWVPYLWSLATVSIVGAVRASTFTDGLTLSPLGVVTMTIAYLVYALPVTLILAMPLAFLLWREQQIRATSVSHMQAGVIGLVAGALIHTLFLLFFDGWKAAPQILISAALSGGVFGFTFAAMFSKRGGFELQEVQQVEAL